MANKKSKKVTNNTEAGAPFKYEHDDPVHLVDEFCANLRSEIEPPTVRTPANFTHEEKMRMVTQLIYTYSHDDTPAIVLDGYDTIRNIPSMADLLGLTIRPKLEWPTDWEMIYDYRRVADRGPHKGKKLGSLAVLLDIQVANKLSSKADKVRTGLDTIKGYFVERNHPIWDELMMHMESEAPGISIAGL
jgi:hypothetical protein